jgi:hypothetical protein
VFDLFYWFCFYFVFDYFFFFFAGAWFLNLSHQYGWSRFYWDLRSFVLWDKWSRMVSYSVRHLHLHIRAILFYGQKYPTKGVNLFLSDNLLY